MSSCIFRLRILPSFCNTETVNSRAKKEKKNVEWGRKLSGQVYVALCLKKRGKILFDLVWQFGTCIPESRYNQISLSISLSTGLTSQDTV